MMVFQSLGGGIAGGWAGGRRPHAPPPLTHTDPAAAEPPSAPRRVNGAAPLQRAAPWLHCDLVNRAREILLWTTR